MNLLILIFFLLMYSISESKIDNAFVNMKLNNANNDSTININYESFNIGDDEKLYYSYLYKDNNIILWVKMDAKTGVIPAGSYICLEKSSKKMNPFYSSKNINSEINQDMKTGVLIYDLEDNISPANWDENKYSIKLKNKKGNSKIINIDLKLLNSKFYIFDNIYNSNIDHEFKIALLEPMMILTINAIENNPKSVDTAFCREIQNDVKNDPFLKESYLKYYIMSFISDNISSSVLQLDSSFLKKNNMPKFKEIYFNKSVEYLDSLFKNESFEEINYRSDTCLFRFKDLLSSNQDKKNRLKFYSTYSKYYLMEKDQEIKDDSTKLIVGFLDLIKEFNKNDMTKVLEYYSRLALGNIYFVIGNNDAAQYEYYSLIKENDVPSEIKDTAIQNLKKVKNAK